MNMYMYVAWKFSSSAGELENSRRMQLKKKRNSKRASSQRIHIQYFFQVHLFDKIINGKLKDHLIKFIRATGKSLRRETHHVTYRDSVERKIDAQKWNADNQHARPAELIYDEAAASIYRSEPSGCLAINDALRSFNVVRVLQGEYRWSRYSGVGYIPIHMYYARIYRRQLQFNWQ